MTAPPLIAEAYLEQIRASLPRLLGLFDVNPLSASYGLGDRLRWAWKTIDFGNGTYQGAAHGLARLLVAGRLDEFVSDEAALTRINAIFEATRRLQDRDGSFGEALPHEQSFCVTALVAHDLLCAVELLTPLVDPKRRAAWLDVVQPAIEFLKRRDEYHGLISNHLATATAALFRWHRLTGDTAARDRGQLFLDRILQHQSTEGWFSEYGGFDPGYLTLCLHYLVDLHVAQPELGLAEPLAKAVRLLTHFVHPDGSFGGLYGSRNTRFYYPSGIEALAGELPEAAALAHAMRTSIQELRVVGLASMDDSNLIPMFNSYCWAATSVDPDDAESTSLPVQSRTAYRLRLDEAGLLVDHGPEHHSIVSWKKGGVCYHFRNERLAFVDAGAVARDHRDRRFTTQAMTPETQLVVTDDGALEIATPMVQFQTRLPSPWQFAILRLLCCTLFRMAWMCNLIKRFLVRFVITGRRASRSVNRRRIRLGPDCEISDTWQANPDRLEYVAVEEPFSALPMASQGYWQRQDDRA
jgi:hypothetical protein